MWDKLNQKGVKLALQLHMQHFHITFLPRWSAPKFTIATEYSLRDILEEGVKYDYARYLIYKFHRGKKSIEHTRNSKSVRPNPMYLGGVLVLIQIVYFAMGNLAQLPPPLHIPQGIIPRHTTRLIAKDRTQQEGGTRRITQSKVKKLQKMLRSSPMSSSYLDKKTKEY